MKKIYLILFFVVVLAGLVFATSEFSKKVNIDSEDEQPVFCTSDAKMCPDGSYVGRSGPLCEFVCPDLVN